MGVGEMGFNTVSLTCQWKFKKEGMQFAPSDA